MFTDKNIINTQYNQLVKIHYSGSGLDIKDAPEWLPKATFSRTNTDLIATNSNNESHIFIDYFTNFELPSILTDNGLMMKGSLLETLAGRLSKAQYVQAASGNILSIGEVSTKDGSVTATRLDGTSVDLNIGDPVFQGDTIETTGSGSVGLVFLDKTTLSLSDSGKMVLDELIFDPSTSTGSMAVDMLEGAFSFVSGEIAKTGPDAMKVSTPVATIGIRGTTVAGKAAVEGNENSFTLLQDADGGVGQISVSNDGGTQVLQQVGATTSISSFTAPPPPPIILTAAQIQANYGTALNVLPPTPAVAPTPQIAPAPAQEEQEQQIQEESQEEETIDEEISEDESSADSDEEGLPEGEEPLEGEGPAEGDGPAVGPDGEPLPSGEGGPPLGPDGEPLLPGEGDSLIGPDGEPLSAVEDGPTLGLDGESLPPGEGGPPLGPDGEPLSSEQENAGREAFQQALAGGATPEEAMAAAAEAAGFDGPISPGGPGGDFGPGGTGGLGGDFDAGGPGEPVGDPFGGLGFAGDPSADTFVNPGGDFDSPFSGPGGPLGVSGGPGGFNPSSFGGPVVFGPADPYSGPGGFGPDPYGGPGGFGPDPFGGPVDPIMGGGYHMGFTDPLGGPVFNAIYNDFGGGFIEAYGDGLYMMESVYFFDDPALYDDYIPPGEFEEEYQTEELNETDFTLSGTNNADNISASSSNSSYTLAGYSGGDVITGGAGNDVLWGGLGIDSLTGGDGNDQFYYTDLLEGPDVITDFGQNADQDKILFAYTPSSAYTRTSVAEVDSVIEGFDYLANGNILPYVFAFEDSSLYGITSTSTLATTLTNSNFKIWADKGNGTVLTGEKYFLLTPGTSDTGINVFVWTDGETPRGLNTGTSDGVVDSTELSYIASLAGGDTSNITGDEFAFQSISGFSV